jgi:hypothetical protein
MTFCRAESAHPTQLHGPRPNASGSSGQNATRFRTIYAAQSVRCTGAAVTPSRHRSNPPNASEHPRGQVTPALDVRVACDWEAMGSVATK